MSEATLQRREVRYRGDVQGVGFRYSAVQAVRGFAVTGFVRNEADGSVRLVAEGTPTEIDAFLRNLGDVMSDHIRDMAVQNLPATGEFRDFSVRR